MELRGEQLVRESAHSILRFHARREAAAKFEKLDTYHVRITFAEPYITFPEMLCGIKELCDTPEHYLKR